MTGIEKIKNCLNNFVKNGGDVNALTKKDEVYMIVRNTEVYIDGKRLTMEEKFRLAGHPRKGKDFDSAESRLINEAERYSLSGGDFDLSRKELPFYETLHTAIRTKRANLGYHISEEDYMKSLGFPEYSDRHKRFSKLFELKKYQDENGFVDSYRKDSEMKNYVHSCAQTLDIPIAVVVELIANQNLKRHVVDSDYMQTVKDGLLEYLNEHGDFDGIKRNSPKLYERLVALTKYITGAVGEELSNADTIALMDLKDSMGTFSSRAKNRDSIEEVMTRLRAVAEENGGSITRADIPDGEYRKLLTESMKQGCYLSGLFSAYKIEYDGGRNNKRLKKIYINEYPYMREMQKERDESYLRFVKANPTLSKQECFEVYLELCLGIYDKYKSKIYNFDVEKEESFEE